MTCGATEVDQTAFSKQDDVFAINRVLVHLGFDFDLGIAVVGDVEGFDVVGLGVVGLVVGVAEGHDTSFEG